MFIFIILLFIVVAYLLLRVTSKLWAPLLMFGVLLMGISIMLVPRVTLLNSPYYVHKYKNVVESNYNVILQSLNKGETRQQLDDQIKITNNSIYLLKQASYKLPLLKSTYIDKCNLLESENKTILDNNYSANEISSIIKNKCLEEI